MNSSNLIPCLPDNAPFTPEQRAYLNGFIAGLYSRRPVSDAAPPGATPAPGLRPLIPLSILFGSQTGNAEKLAKRVAKEAGQRGFAATIHEMSQYPFAQLASETRVLIVASTFGDGEPPDNARSFWDKLASEAAPRLTQTRFSVCALGDSNYPKFCAFGKALETRFRELGAQCVCERADCDVEYEKPAGDWLDAALKLMAQPQDESPGSAVPPAGDTAKSSIDTNGQQSPDRIEADARAHSIFGSELRAHMNAVPSGDPSQSPDARPPFSRANPFQAALLANRFLNKPGSGKDTRHFEIDLKGSDLRYQAGDALGVYPSNCPTLVEELLITLRFEGGEAVPGRGGVVPVREAFLNHYEITKIPTLLLRVMSERTGDPQLKKLAAPEANGELTSFIRGREIIDLLAAHPDVRFTPIEFVGLLKKLAPRLYSISSSPKTHEGQVHLTVNVVRYESLSRKRKGVCSTFLAERVAPNASVPVFVHENRNFRLPSDPARPMIMVGPGTGIAPFRGFLHERIATGAPGRNWLFYGDQRSDTDFMYQDELQSFVNSGTLTRLDTAFSRDQTQKVYVQDRMREHSKALFAWLEEGAHFYVCGDASRMAKDVDATLHEILKEAGGMTSDRAAEYVSRMKAEKRYQRDVY